MKIILPLFIGIILLHVSFRGFGQTCNDTPSVSTGTHTNITTTAATLGGNVTDEGTGSCDVIETGVEWSTTSGGPYTKVVGSETGSGTFTVNVTGLPAGTNIFYRGYGRNDNSDPLEHTDYTGENDFFTLALQPTSHAASLSANAIATDEIELTFPAASSITNADGYIILINQGSAAALTNLDDGSLPDGANDFLVRINSTSTTTYIATGLTLNTNYHFAIVPYNREGDDDTYNYLTTAGFPTANATTQADVAISALAGGLAPTATPLNSSSTDRALAGFSLNGSGPLTFQSVIVHLSSTTAGKLSNFRLCESANATFDGVGTDAPLGGITITPTGTEITITLSESILATPTRNFFLVADVDPSVNASTPSVQFSYDEGDFTFNPNNISGLVSQTRTYTFADVTPPSLVTITPVDNATAVDFNLNKLILTFNENVDNITTAAGSTADQVIIYDDATDLPALVVDRANVVATGNTTVEVNIPAATLSPNSDYYVLIGNAVIEDVPADNDWGGISTQTVWNFSTSGVTVNNVTSNICSGSFQSMGNIVITEEASGDFITSGVINLDFANTDFGYDISSVTVSAGP
ncbi:MAG: Ig-like domain-containing protein, partial [Cyclobacteriaceae bacterium]